MKKGHYNIYEMPYSWIHSSLIFLSRYTRGANAKGRDPLLVGFGRSWLWEKGIWAFMGLNVKKILLCLFFLTIEVQAN